MKANVVVAKSILAVWATYLVKATPEADKSWKFKNPVT